MHEKLVFGGYIGMGVVGRGPVLTVPIYPPKHRLRGLYHGGLYHVYPTGYQHIQLMKNQN
jgi:hypothetical protein